MAVELFRKGDLVRLTIGGFDSEQESYMVNAHQMENLKTALFFWHYEAELHKEPPRRVYVDDEGKTTVQRFSEEER